MISIKTPVGRLYLESVNSREERDRIKLYDSLRRYLDYFSLEYLDVETPEQYEEEIIASLQKCRSIKQLIAQLGLEVETYSKDWKKIGKKLYGDEIIVETGGELYYIPMHRRLGIGDLMKNEFMNQVGDTYILIAE